MNLSELTKESLRRFGNKQSRANPDKNMDFGFRVFKIDTSNVRTWEPGHDDLEGALLDSVDHIKTDRSEHDILYELLLKPGLDLCAPIETRIIRGKSVRAIVAGILIVCLDETISQEETKPLVLGIADWHDKLAPAGKITVVFRDSASADDVTKTNLAAILGQHGPRALQSL